MENEQSNEKNSGQKNNQVSQEEIKKLLEKNLELNQEIYVLVSKMNKWIFWQRIWSVLKIAVIIIPLAIGFLYLPPLLKDAFSQYQELLGIGSSSSTLNSLMEYQDLLK